MLLMFDFQLFVDYLPDMHAHSDKILNNTFL